MPPLRAATTEASARGPACPGRARTSLGRLVHRPRRWLGRRRAEGLPSGPDRGGIGLRL